MKRILEIEENSDSPTIDLLEEAKSLSPSVITKLTVKWQAEYDEWRKRDLSGKGYVYVWADGIYVKSRLDGEKTCLLVIIGVTVEGKKELVAVQAGIRESTESWRGVLLDLKFRGLTKAPKLAVCDGALGFQNAVDEIWGQLKIQRCWFHKSTKGNGSSAASVAMAFKRCLQAEKNWRRFRGFKQLELVAKNIIFVDGEQMKAA